MIIHDFWVVKLILRSSYRAMPDDGDEMEIWNDEGRTLLVPRSECATVSAVRDQMGEMVVPEWMVLEVVVPRDA